MKIAFDATALYGRMGGIENALWQTFSRLRALDFENDYLVFVPRDAPSPPSPTNPRWSWHRLPFNGADKARRIVWQQLELPRLLRRHRCDILHAWNYVAPLVSPIPVVLTVQDLIALNHSAYATRFNRIHYRALMPQSLKRASRVIVATSKTRAEVLRRVPRAHVRVIPLGLDLEFHGEVIELERQRVIEKFNLPPRFLLYVGNFEPKKNLPNLLRALKTLPDAPPLVVAGGIKPWHGSDAMLRGVQNLGFVARADLPALYSLGAAFCFPSRCEGFGLPVLEALSCGAPVLASSEVPLPNLETFAEMPNPRDVMAIARALSKLLKSPRPSAGAREYARSFNWDNTARATLAVYRELGQEVE